MVTSGVRRKKKRAGKRGEDGWETPRAALRRAVPPSLPQVMAVALAALVSNVGRRWAASARTIEVVLDVHMCAAQPFLEQSIDQYASLCRNPHDPMHWVVELWDGSTMSSHEFLERVAKDKKLFGKGSWGPNADHSRMLFTPLKPGQTGVLPITKFLVLRHPSDLSGEQNDALG